jgi:membrane protein
MKPAKQPRSPSLLSRVGLVLAYAALVTVLPNKRTAEPFEKRPEHAPEPELGTPSSKGESVAVQQARARQPGRGRHAAHPGQIPWKGWKDILWRTYAQIQEDRLLAISAGVVFFALLAIFPAVTALVSLYGLFASSATIHGHLAFLSTLMPGVAVGIIDEQVARVVSKGDIKLGFGVLAGLGIALWSANGGMKALIDAMNIVSEEEETRGFFKLNLISLAFTLGAIGALLLAIGAVVVLPLILDRFWLGPFADALATYGRWPVLWLGLLIGLSVLYRYAPNRREPKWKWVSIGGVLASVLWIVGSVAFSYYLEKYAHYDATYGSLGAGIGMMMWMWMTTIVILFGAELNSEIEHQTAVDTTKGPPKPMGTRGATMADTVGPAQSN